MSTNKHSGEATEKVDAREAFIQHMIETRDLSRSMAEHLWDSGSPLVREWSAPAQKQPSLVECDACPTSGGCIEVCMKASAPASTEKTSDYSRVMMVGAFELGPRTLPMQVTDAGRNPLYEGLFEGETEDQRLARIVTAKDAEIARSKEAIGLWVDRASNWAKVNDELRTRLTEKDAAHAVTLEELHAMEVHVARAGREIEELRAQLAAQQAAVPEWASKLLHEASKLGRDIWTTGLQAGGEQYPNAHCCIDLAQRIDKAMRNAPAAPQQGVVVPEALLRRLIQGKAQDHESRAEGAALLREFARLNADRSAQGEKP